MIKRNITLCIFFYLISTSIFAQKYFKFDAAIGANHTTQLQGDNSETKTILGFSKSMEFLLGKSFKKCPFAIELGFRMTSLTNNTKSNTLPIAFSERGYDKVTLQSMTLLQIPLLFKWNLLPYPLKNEKKRMVNEKTKRWNFFLSTGVIYADYLDLNYKEVFEDPKPFVFKDKLVTSKHNVYSTYSNTRSIALSFGFDAAYKINEKMDAFVSIENTFGLNPILYAQTRVDVYYNDPNQPSLIYYLTNSSNGTNQMLRLGFKRLF
jgi:hypothetical protein